jgi:hypothetical protein
MTEYDIDIRELEPTYKHTLAQQANREVNDGREVHLSGISVKVTLKELGGERSRFNYTIRFGVDHERYSITFKSCGDTHEHRHQYEPEQFWLATNAAAAVVDEWLEDIGLDYTRPEEEIVLPDEGDEFRVHNDLMIIPDEAEK